MPNPRSFWMDNAKGALLFLVVFGHLIEPAAFDLGIGAGVYGAIYLFHMPAFALVSGMLARPQLGRPEVRSIAIFLLLPLLVCQLLYWPLLDAVAPNLVGDAVTPNWILWYLLSLATWRLTLPLVLRVRYPLALTIGLALAAGTLDWVGLEASLSRTVVLFPAFLCGYLVRDRIPVPEPAHRRLAGLVFLGLTGSAAIYFAAGGNIHLLYHTHPYAAWTESPITMALTRLVLLAAGLAAALAFLILMPQRETPVAAVGRRALNVYLGHGFLVLAYWALVPASILAAPVAFLLLSAGLAAAITAVLSRLIAPGQPTARVV